MVDTPEKVAFLKDCDIDYGQGYLFGKGESVPATKSGYDPVGEVIHAPV